MKGESISNYRIAVNTYLTQFGIAATLSEGVEIDKALSWVHADERIKGRYEMNDGIARINLRHIVFTAKSREVELAIDNAAASPGEELGGELPFPQSVFRAIADPPAPDFRRVGSGYEVCGKVFGIWLPRLP